MLAPYALRAEDSRGRRYPEPAHAYRNVFQRDRDRVVHSRAFRRLENKTQVFTRRYSDHFRNRLTHTIEVAQISRTIAAELGLNEDLVEALALVHDVGHPPFGHAGERTLDAAMRRHHDRFDHNLHALRIVEQFEQRYADFPGLNLSFEVREGIVKHSGARDPREFPELSEYLLGLQPPLEAQLIDLTDEIAYSTADLDDGVEAMILTPEQITAGVAMFGELHSEVERLHPQAAEKLRFNETLKRVLDRLVTDLIVSSRKTIKASGVASADDVRRKGRPLFAFSDQVAREHRQLREFLFQNLYFCPALQPEKDQAEQVITDLFEFFVRFPDELPASYHEKMQREPVYRVVCDYLAGMTDSYILEQHRKLDSAAKRASL